MWQRKNSDRPALTVDQLRYKAAAYCSTAEHCPSEVREKLIGWGAERDDIDGIIDHLIDENFINEARYCTSFVNDKIRFQSWGKEKIRMALIQKRLPSALITEAIDAFPEDEYMTILIALVAKKTNELKGEEAEVFQGKMVRFLTGRGFGFSDIQRAVGHLTEDC